MHGGAGHLWEYYKRVALQRGIHAKRNVGITSDRAISHGEGYRSLFPRVTRELSNLKGGVVRHIERAAAALVSRFADYGVATVHEAQQRQGRLDKRVRPIQQGRAIAGSAVTVLVTPGDNWIFHVTVEQCQPVDVLLVSQTLDCYDGFFGDLLATSLQAVE